MTRSIVLHGHFYQPPREDPWLDEVPREPSAAPYHDWNRRIEAECYRAVVAARMPGADGRIAGILNTLEWLSFNFGPTLLEWMEREAPASYTAMLVADRTSRARCGHGNAIAMPYHHIILPLASRRDKVTEVRWGLADFRRRFGRDAEGMWLPETAVDEETLDVLAAEGVQFTVVAPHQVTRVPSRGLPGLVRTTSGQRLALFVYDGPLSHGVAFGELLKDAGKLVDGLTTPAPGHEPAVVSVATDGETYGHHHRFSEMALAAAIDALRRRPDVRVENFAAVLARHPAHEEVHLVSPSSWSCAHGVERWRADCGCKMAPHVPSQQAWRAPLRTALDWLAGELHAVFAAEGQTLLGAPWVARDDYGAVVAQAGEPMAQFVRARRTGPPGAEADVRARELLEMERDALRMFTSCGWFFDDIAGLEGRQILGYAARAIALSGPHAARLEAGLLERLAAASSNDPAEGTGADFYTRRVRPVQPAAARVAGGYAVERALAPTEPPPDHWRWDVTEEDGGALVTRDRRTGRTTSWRAVVERPSPGSVAVIVTGEGATYTLSLADLPDRAADRAAAAVRRTVVEDWFTPEECDELLAGTAPFADVAGRALVRAVAALAVEGPAGREAVVVLTDLHTLLSRPIPFDAQTLFARFRAGLDLPGQAAWSDIGRRLGFV